MNFIINISICVVIGACGAIAFMLYKNRDNYFSKVTRLPERLTAFELGQLEGCIKNLIEVIVVSDIVEKPHNTLFTSVETNFKRQVKYRFLVSKKNYLAEINSYYLFFEAMTKTTNCHDCLSINSLSMNWDTYPYIFYRTLTNQKKTTFAYRGTEANEGIADNYVLIPPELAETIANTVNQAILIDMQSPKIEAPTFQKKEFQYQSINLN